MDVVAGLATDDRWVAAAVGLDECRTRVCAGQALVLVVLEDTGGVPSLVGDARPVGGSARGKGEDAAPDDVPGLDAGRNDFLAPEAGPLGALGALGLSLALWDHLDEGGVPAGIDVGDAFALRGFVEGVE